MYAPDRALVADVLTQRWWTHLQEEEQEAVPFDADRHAEGRDVRVPSKQFAALHAPRSMLNPLAPAAFIAPVVVDAGSPELEMLLRLARAPVQVDVWNRTYHLEAALRVQNRALLHRTIGECARHTGDGYRLAFHGAPTAFLASIMGYGFLPHIVKRGAYGPGTYLAHDCEASLSYYSEIYRNPQEEDDGGAQYAAVVVVACTFGELARVGANAVRPTRELHHETQGAIAVHDPGSAQDAVYVVQDFRRIYPAYVLLYRVEWKPDAN